jgi:hypothetical protein
VNIAKVKILSEFISLFSKHETVSAAVIAFHLSVLGPNGLQLQLCKVASGSTPEGAIRFILES